MLQWVMCLCLLLTSQGFILRSFSRQSCLPRRLQASPEANSMYGMNEMIPSTNLIGTKLQPCSYAPATGYFRDGFCNTCQSDFGSHTVCCRMTQEFLEFSKSVGNDLSTPLPEYGFAGLKENDSWCLCASRWSQALEAGKAPLVVVEATHLAAGDVCGLENLLKHAIQKSYGEDEMQ